MHSSVINICIHTYNQTARLGRGDVLGWQRSAPCMLLVVCPVIRCYCDQYGGRAMRGRGVVGGAENVPISTSDKRPGFPLIFVILSLADTLTGTLPAPHTPTYAGTT